MLDTRNSSTAYVVMHKLITDYAMGGFGPEQKHES